MQDNPLWKCEPFTRGQAWVDLILLANHKYGYFYKRGVKVEVQRGQVGVSEKGLSERWQWSRSKVRKFLKDLEKEQQIKQQKSTITQILTINNYDKYQEKEQQKDSRRTAEGQQKDTNKNEKNEKNEKKALDFDCNFKSELIEYFDYLEKEHHRSIGHMQIEQTLKMLSQWYKNDEDKKQCLAANIANGWKTINFVKSENRSTTKQVNPWMYDT